MKQKLVRFIAIFTLALMPLPAFAITVDQLSGAQGSSNGQSSLSAGFNPNKLIDDKVFNDTLTFGSADGIQKFLESKKSPLANIGNDFLAKLKEPSSSSLKTALSDPHPGSGKLRTAAELIWDVSQAWGLNPQVILVTLNKEQSLIDGRATADAATMQKALDNALGFGCPDGTGCGDLFPGFYFQLFGNLDADGNRYLGAAASLMKSFNTPEGRGPAVSGGISKVGDVITLDNTQGPPYNCPAQQAVTLSNRATAALYRYTPHVCNGNYNFVKFFTAWFRYPNGTIMKLSKGNDLFIIQNGARLLLPQFVAQARNLDVKSAITVSPKEIEDYPQDKILGPADNTVVKIEGQTQTYVFINNIKHPASEFVIKQRGLNPAATLTVSAADAKLFEDGVILAPSDGTVVRGQKNPAIYLVEKGSLKLFSAFTFKQRNIAANKIQLVTDEEIATYPKQGFVAPLDGTVVKSDKNPTVYYVQSGLKQPVTGELFKNRGFKTVSIISDDEVKAMATGSFVTPKDKSFFQVAQTKQLYIYKEGSKHPISAFVAKQRSITPDFTFDQGVVKDWTDGTPIPPKDGSLLMGDKGATVYVVEKGQLRAVSGTVFQKRKYSFKNVQLLTQAEIDSYAKGDPLLK